MSEVKKNMLFKNMGKLLFLFIILLMYISAISAVDDSTDAVQGVALNDSDVLSYSNDLNDLVGDRGTPGSFTDLQTIINNASAGSTITLDKDYVYNNLTDSNPITINKKLTILGNNFTLNGNNQSAILKIKGFGLSHVVLDNITFINGYSDESGAAIYSLSDDIEIKNCYFKNNKADDAYGGAIYLGWDRGIISNCVFINNTAGHGGAIYTANNNFRIKNSTFKKNNAPRGGAIYFDSNGILEDSIFIYNNAEYGGAIFVNDETVTIVNSSFNDNYAIHWGGAISFQSDEGNIINSSFKNNNANGSGGAVFFHCKEGNIINSSFKNNNANGSGGAVYCPSNANNIKILF